MTATRTKIFNRIAILGMGRSGQAVLDACMEDGIFVNVFDDKGPTPRTEACFKDFNDWDMDGLAAMDHVIEVRGGDSLGVQYLGLSLGGAP